MRPPELPGRPSWGSRQTEQLILLAALLGYARGIQHLFLVEIYIHITHRSCMLIPKIVKKVYIIFISVY